MNPEVFHAASTGNSSLFENSTDPNGSILLQVTIEKNTALHVAVQFKQFDVPEKIVNLSPRLVYETNSKGNTPLHVAARVGDSSMAKLLIDQAKKLDVEAGGRQQLLSMVNQDGDTTLHVAVRYGNSKVVKELIKGKDPAELAKQVNKAGESALFLAVDRQHYDMASYILSNAPDSSYVGRHGMNVLHAFVLQTTSNYLVKEVMGKWPSTIEQGDNSGWTPLHIAAHMGNEEFVKLLLEKGSSPAYVRDKEGLSVLHIAAKEGNIQVMQEIVMACPGIYELLDKRGKTALHVAAESGARDAVMFFLRRPEFEGLINEQDEEGNTPLHLAAIKGNYEVLSLLGHQRGVDFYAKAKQGSTIMDIVFQTKEDYMHWNLDPTRKVKLAGDGKDKEGSNYVKQVSDGKGKEGSNFVKQVSETNLLVATLIATVTFTAAFTVPGGFNQNGGVDEGLAVLSKKTAFRVFLIANIIAFGLSTTSIFVNFLASISSMTIREVDFRRKVLRRAPIFTNWSIGAMLVAFIAGTYTVVPHSLGITVGLILCCCFLISLLFPLLIK